MPCSIEREIKRPVAGPTHAVRQERSVPLVTELERWMIETRDKLSRGHDLSKAFNYMLRRWSSFTRFLDVCFWHGPAPVSRKPSASTQTTFS